MVFSVMTVCQLMVNILSKYVSKKKKVFFFFEVVSTYLHAVIALNTTKYKSSYMKYETWISQLKM